MKIIRPLVASKQQQVKEVESEVLECFTQTKMRRLTTVENEFNLLPSWILYCPCNIACFITAILDSPFATINRILTTTAYWLWIMGKTPSLMSDSFPWVRRRENGQWFGLMFVDERPNSGLQSDKISLDIRIAKLHYESLNLAYVVS